MMTMRKISTIPGQGVGKMAIKGKMQPMTEFGEHTDNKTKIKLHKLLNTTFVDVIH